MLFRYYRFLEPILGFTNYAGDLSLDASQDNTTDSDQETGDGLFFF